MFSAVLTKLPGFVCNAHHSGTQSLGLSASDVSQQLPPVSHVHCGAVTLHIKAKYLKVMSITCIWMCISSRVIQTTLPVQSHRTPTFRNLHNQHLSVNDIFIIWTGWTLAVAFSYDDSTINIVVIITARRYAERGICYGNYVRLSVCLSVRPSVRPSVTRVDQSKTVEAKIMQFSPYSSPIPLVFDR